MQPKVKYYKARKRIIAEESRKRILTMRRFKKLDRELLLTPEIYLMRLIKRQV